MQSSPTNSTTINLKVDFGEPVTGFVSGDITLSAPPWDSAAATASNFAGSGATYTFDVVTAGDGVLDVAIAAGVAQNTAAGKNNAATDRFRMVRDTLAPDPVITANRANPADPQTVSFDMVFNEHINATTLDESDIDVTSGTVQNLRLEPRYNGTVDVYTAGSVAVDSSTGTVYVAETGRDRVLVFNSTRDHVANPPGQFGNPSGVAVDISSGTVYVADTNNHRVKVFNNTWDHVATIAGLFLHPFGVAVDSSSGTVYVADTYSVKVFNSSLHHVATLPLSVDRPSGVAVDSSSGTVYVAGSGLHHYVHVYNNTWDRVATLPGPFGDPFGVAVGSFSGPVSDVAVDSSSGTVYVADTSSHRVLVFNNTRDHIATLPGPFSNPSGVAVDSSSGTVYVADTGNHRVQIFDPAYAFDVTDPDDGQMLTVDMPAGRVQDAAGNLNVASDTTSIAITGTGPIPIITSVQSSPTNSTTINLKVDFGEPVTGFVSGGHHAFGHRRGRRGGSGVQFCRQWRHLYV